MEGMDADAYGVASLSLVAGLVFKLIESGAMSKADVLEVYEQVAQAKLAKGELYGNAAEHGAGVLVTTMKAEIEARY